MKQDGFIFKKSIDLAEKWILEAYKMEPADQDNRSSITNLHKTRQGKRSKFFR